MLVILMLFYAFQPVVGVVTVPQPLSMEEFD